MPLWKVYHPIDAFTDAEKQDIAEKITKLYHGWGLPSFYVGVVFQEIQERSFYIGGKPTKNFVRIWIDHIARQYQSPEAVEYSLNAFNAVLAPYVRDRGYDWEFHIDETPFEFWSVQGYRPPPENTEDFARWVRENKASPLVGKGAAR